MADNVTITAGTGTTVAADEIAGIKHQRVKIQHGADGSATDASAADPLPVSLPAATVTTLTPPAAITGFATAANQTTEIASLATLAGHVDGLETAVAATNTKLDTVNTNLTTIDGRVDAVEAKLDSIITNTAAATPAGTNNIGDVDIASIAAGDNNIGNVDVASLPALPAGTNNIGDVDVLTLPALPAGSNNIGATTDAGPSWTTVYGVSGARFTSADASGADAAVTDAPTGGQKLVITDIILSVDTAMRVDFKLETAGTVLFSIYMAANGAGQITIRSKFKLATADKKLMVRTSVAGNVAVTPFYYSEA